MNIDELKTLTRQAYRDCHSYQDSGWMSETNPERQETVKRVEFSTWFSAPSRFRMDFRAIEPYGTVTTGLWSNEQGVFLWKAGNEPKKVGTLVDALRSMRGVSRAVSFYVPSLLIGDKRDILDTDFCELIDVVFRHVTCYRLQAKSEQEHICIDIQQNDLTIRQIAKEATVDPVAVFDAKTLVKVSKDLAEDGADADTILRPFTSISDVTYDSVVVNRVIAPDIFVRPFDLNRQASP